MTCLVVEAHQVGPGILRLWWFEGGQGSKMVKANHACRESLVGWICLVLHALLTPKSRPFGLDLLGAGLFPFPQGTMERRASY